MAITEPVSQKKRRVHRALAATPEKIQASIDQYDRSREFEMIKLGLPAKSTIDQFIASHTPQSGNPQLELPWGDTGFERETQRALFQAHQIAPYNRFIRSLFTQFMQRGTLTEKQFTALIAITAKEAANARRVETVICPHCGGHLGMEVGAIKEFNRLTEEEQSKLNPAVDRFKKLL